MSISDSTNPVDALIEILEATDTAEWTLSKPEINRHDEISPKGRENNQDDAVYVRSAAGVSFDRFSADPSDLKQDGSPTVLVYSLDEDRARTHAGDIVEFLRQLMNDNYAQTAFHNIEPTEVVDNRASKITRQTNHFVFGVTAETHRLD